MAATQVTRTVNVNAGGLPDIHVSIPDREFDPSSINAQVGQRIIWTNNDSDEHTVTSGECPSDPLWQ